MYLYLYLYLWLSPRKYTDSEKGGWPGLGHGRVHLRTDLLPVECVESRVCSDPWSWSLLPTQYQESPGHSPTFRFLPASGARAPADGNLAASRMRRNPGQDPRRDRRMMRCETMLVLLLVLVLVLVLVMLLLVVLLRSRRGASSGLLDDGRARGLFRGARACARRRRRSRMRPGELFKLSGTPRLPFREFSLFAGAGVAVRECGARSSHLDAPTRSRRRGAESKKAARG